MVQHVLLIIGESLTSPNNTFRFRQFLPQYLSCPPGSLPTQTGGQQAVCSTENLQILATRQCHCEGKKKPCIKLNAQIELRLTCQAGYMQMAVGCQMQIILKKKHIIAHSCTQETHILQIIAHRRHSLHCIGGSCMLQGSRQPFKGSRISNLDQTNSLSRFTSYKWFEDICSQDINFCGYWLLESSWALALQTSPHL